jgi:hypothetical protein
VRFKKILDGWIQIHERNRKIQDLRELHKDPGKYMEIQNEISMGNTRWSRRDTWEIEENPGWEIQAYPLEKQGNSEWEIQENPGDIQRDLGWEIRGEIHGRYTDRKTGKSWMWDRRRSIRNIGKSWMRDTGKFRGNTARSEIREIHWRYSEIEENPGCEIQRNPGREIQGDSVKSVWEIHGRYTQRDRKILDVRYKKIKKTYREILDERYSEIRVGDPWKIQGNPGRDIEISWMWDTGKSRSDTERS